MCVLSVGEVNQVNTSTIEFDLGIKRTSNLWFKWANGTFQLRVAGVASEKYADSVMRVELVSGTSQLSLAPFNATGLDNYFITPRVFPGRISITVIGPDSIENSRLMPLDSVIRLGRFRVTMTDGSRLGTELQWATPIDYYQANAYKLDVDSVGKEQTYWYYTHDNVEMRNYPRINTGTTTRIRRDSFQITPPPPPCATIRDSSFLATYLGDRFVRLNWYTQCEQGIAGFIIRRRIVECPGLKPSDLEFREIRRYGTTFDQTLVSRGNTANGWGYEMSAPPDTITYRDVIYEYELAAQFNDGSRRALDTTRVHIPNAVIATAIAYPNPMVNATTIRYTVNDRVRLTAKVYDVTGKELAILLDNVVTARTIPGAEPYTVRWNAPDQASQGLYNVVLIARPVDDPTIELSRAVLKLQLLR